MTERSDEYAVCPYCGYHHGDCWEWVTERSQEFTCNCCERKFIVYADYQVTYITRPISPD